tara:strand:+ start:4893 stop:5537 length:645 start_codon:yes stop_codon:yes gene_type:complete
MQIPKWIFLSICLTAPMPSFAIDCPNCTPEELYREKIKLMKSIAMDMKQIDGLLKDLSPETIAVIEKIMTDLDQDTPAMEAMKISTANAKNRLIKKNRNEALARAAAKAKIRGGSVRPFQIRDIAKKPNIVSPLSKGLWLTFVRDTGDPERRSAIISIDGTSINLGLNELFSYQNRRYKLSSIEAESRSKDNRKYSVLIKNVATEVVTRLAWAQ